MAEGLESPIRREEDGREEEGEEGRSPVRIPTPVVVSKAEKQEHELTHMLEVETSNIEEEKRKESWRSSLGSSSIIFLSYQDESAIENPMMVIQTGDKYARAVGQT